MMGGRGGEERRRGEERRGEEKEKWREGRERRWRVKMVANVVQNMHFISLSSICIWYQVSMVFPSPWDHVSCLVF